jgi:hypothetical protein
LEIGNKPKNAINSLAYKKVRIASCVVFKKLSLKEQKKIKPTLKHNRKDLKQQQQQQSSKL